VVQLSPAPPPALSFARSRRAARWIARGLLALVALLAVLLAGVLVLARDLAQPWVKQQVRALVQHSAGYEIDYAAAGLHGSTLTLEGLVVRGAKPLRALAPTLLQAEHVTAQLALRAPQLRALNIERATVTLAVDEHGRSSFDTPPSKHPSKPTPLSAQAASVLEGRLPLGQARLTDLTVVFLRSQDGRAVERDEVRGLSLAIATRAVAEGTRLTVRSSEDPITLTRVPRGTARGVLALSLDATPREATLSLRVKIAQQDLVPALAVSDLARIEAHATFAKGASSIEVRELEVGDGAATATAALTLPDQGGALIREAHGDLDARHLLELATPWWPDVALRAGQLHYSVHDFTLDRPATQASLAIAGELHGLELAGVAIGRAKLDVKARPSAAGLQVQGHATLDRGIAQDVRMEGVTLALTGTQDARGEVSLGGTLRADRLHTPQLELPLQATFALAGREPSHGHASLTAHAAGVTLALDATRELDAVDYELSASAPDLALLRPWLAPELAQRMPLTEMATTLHSKGRVEHLFGEPWLRERSELSMQHAAFDELGARTLELTLEGQGDRLRHSLRAELRVHGLQYAELQRAHERVQLTLAFDREAPTLELALRTDRRTALQAKLAFAKGVLDYDLKGRLADLTPLAGLLSQSPALAGFDVRELELELASHGRVRGLVRRADERGLVLADDPLRTLGGEGAISIRSNQFRWAQGDLAVSIPTASWEATLRGEGGRRTIESELRAAQVEAALGSERVSMAEVHDHTALTLTGGIRDGVVEHEQHLHVHRLEQQVAGGYAVGDLEASLRARREPDGLIKLHELRIDNQAGGTRLSLSGGLQLSRDEQRLSVRSLLEQDLSRMPALFEGQGKLALDVALSSSDLRLFHAAAKLRLEGATVRLPKAQVALEAMDGDLPVVSDFLVDRDGVELLRGARINPYAAQRFTDQHPALGYRSFMSIARVKTPFFSCAPFAANLEVARNVVSLSQVELGVRGGTITGSGLLEYDGLDSKLDANLRASGVGSSHGEPFDGNAALTIGVRDRSIEGRADILRIGRRHLTDLLDLQDPLHADAGLNQMRRALRFGYPDRVRLSFQHGFANAGVKFGGLARLIKLNDIRGIPLGPLVERMVSSIQPEPATP
jgi:translocation and assembly module TamB